MRKLAALVLAILLVAPTQAAVHETVNLEGLFAGYRDVYFNGDLPPTDIGFDVPGGETQQKKRLGEAWCNTPQECYILINPVMRTHDTYLDLLVMHEICHVSLWYVPGVAEVDGGHGPQFQACMLRLANEGAMKDVW